jgi:hypothetical protein
MKQTTYILLLGDFINAIIALAAAEVIRFGASENLARLFSERLPTLVVVISVILFSSYFSELYDRERFLSRSELLLRLAVVLILSFFILTVIFYLVPSLSRRVREILARSLFLVPGYGAQGGGAEASVAGFVPGPDGRLEGGLVSSSRGISFPAEGHDADGKGWEQAVDRALEAAIGELSAAVGG